MYSRAIHMGRYLFSTLFDSRVIPNLSPVKFTDIMGGNPIYTPHPQDTSDLHINKIIYNTQTSKFRIITLSDTQNDFLIVWDISLNGCNGLPMPTFTIIVEYEDGRIFQTFPSNGNRKKDTLFGNTLLHLPTPAVGSRVDYYISLVNQSGVECAYSRDVYQPANILIAAI